MRSLISGLGLGASVFLGASLLPACGQPLAEDQAPDTAALAEPLLSDVLRLASRADGLFDVYCKDGRVEHGMSSEKIRKEEICNPPPSSDDPMNPASCQGPLSDVTSLFPPGGVTRNLGTTYAIWQKRMCNPLTGCTAWTPIDSDFAGVVWSGSAELSVDSAEFRLVFNGSVPSHGVSTTLSRCKILRGQITCDPSNYLGSTGYVNLSGQIRQNCLRVTGEAQYPNPLTGRPSGSEYRVAILARF